MTDHCMLCGEPILHGDEEVEISAESYCLRPGGPAHIECADEATLHAITAAQDSADAWFNR